ncbi:S-receptor-like serine/threonine-protein kinase [Parasponia andersonii]|uniref:Receptor-like serine/threonine-protein kinase n=1 Tax=Parasponia andersonii TaxID=3476 RepID=A0A2P5B4R9_PARAD|nr:S-receptor-like serine/threonine-protein kinase [Parasponia andersonii]
MLMEKAPCLFIFFFCAMITICIAVDTITPNQSIDGTGTLISSGKIFELGFFSPGKSKNRYLGIWYKTIPDVIVWVANRDNPLTDSFGEFRISNNSNKLVLLNRSKVIVWSSNSPSSRAGKNPVAQLLDSGNLVLREVDSMNSEYYLWQSFDYPTNTHLPGMKLGWDLRTGLERYLTSWKSDEDPSTGDFTYRMDIHGLPQAVLVMGSSIKFRTGAWNGVRFSGIQLMTSTNGALNFTFSFNENESYYMSEPLVNSTFTTRFTLNHSGIIQRLILENKSTQWGIMYSRPYDPCDNYDYCGVNAICRINGDPICGCLEGFTPRSQQKWDVLNLSKGCRRKIPLTCEKGDGFIDLGGVKLPDLLDFRLDKNRSLKECELACLKDCSCSAYANSDIRQGGSGCLMWFGDLIDVREFKVEGSDQALYIRLSASEIKSIRAEKKKKTLKLILIASVISGLCILALVLWCIIWRLRKTKVRAQGMDDVIELPLFDMAAITVATNNFSPANILGAGGFGPVHKGKLLTGQEIAVKRLSKESRQGAKEFKNEVNLIAKLQHKNLVALLGCCIQGDEKMLIYEYMQNKSLDYFIFEHKRSSRLSWKKSFDIVMGIARGLQYLHHDSKLQIVHRDLKAGNILLDANMTPKISDFGLARIFEGDEKETTTKRVVGTYGYISPEYAVDGIFSVKSDVFSFGVLLLEIISGKQNRGFNHPNHHHSLLGHAWLLWSERKALELMDPYLKESCVESQVLRCIHVGLLCVQKYSKDRPTINSVVVMLSNEGVKLPQPKHPGFFIERSSSTVDQGSSFGNNEESPSVNGVTVTFHGR